MEIVKVVLLAVGLMAFAIFAMAIRIVLKKGGRFPNTHVSGNRYLKRKGVYCAQTQDKLAQRNAWKEVKYNKVSFAPDLKAGR